MKINSMIVALIAMSAGPAMASSQPVQMDSLCVKQIQAGVNVILGGASNFDDNQNPISIDPKDSALVVIDQVRVISSSCLGPDDCDAKNPDAFTYSARISEKDMNLTGSVKVSYHRGNCFVQKVDLDVKSN